MTKAQAEKKLQIAIDKIIDVIDDYEKLDDGLEANSYELGQCLDRLNHVCACISMS